MKQALNLALSMLTHGPADQQNWRWAAVKALTEAYGFGGDEGRQRPSYWVGKRGGTADLD